MTRFVIEGTWSGYASGKTRERNAVLEEAAKCAEDYADRCRDPRWPGGIDAGEDVARYIRALKTNADPQEQLSAAASLPVAPAVAAGQPAESVPLLHPVVQECIDNYGKYYAEQHKLGMSVRSDMIYVAQLALRWADKAAADGQVKTLVDRFLSWPLPDSVCSDLCATTRGYPGRTGTTLLTADEARQMIEYINAAAGSGGQQILRSASQEAPAAGHCQSAAPDRNAAQAEPLSDNYVQRVPYKCDRIIWRGLYYHLDALKNATPDRNAVLEWLDQNTTFYDVQPDGPEVCTAGPNIPVLTSVSKRIWYHATDDQESWPFSKVVERALKNAAPQGSIGRKKLWLWKNFVDGRPEYWAFDNPYPCVVGGGDPQTLGEPCGYAIFKESTRGRNDVSEDEVIAAIKRALAGHCRPAAPAKEQG